MARFQPHPLGEGPLLLLLLLAVLVADAADWDSNCPANCKCTYASNRKMVKCEIGGYTAVPGFFSAEVQELVLPHNAIVKLNSEEFLKVGLVNLQRLQLNANHISSVHQDAFAGLKIMIELDLSDNRIEQLHNQTFTGMEKLRKLDLSGNLLSSLVSRQFPTLMHLQILLLGSNRIKRVHGQAFVNLPNITTISLTNNKLSSLRLEVFTTRRRLVSLELRENPWHCDCSLRPFAKWLEGSVFKKITWSCFSPGRLKEQPWQNVPLEDFACPPTLDTPRKIVSASLTKQNYLSCLSSGDPLPSLEWFVADQLLSNETLISGTEEHYVISIRKNETVVTATLNIRVYGDHHPSEYTCIASNLAGATKKTISVVVGHVDPLDIIVQSGSVMYILIAIGAILIVLLILLLILACYCWIRKRMCRVSSARVNHSVNNSDLLLVSCDESLISSDRSPGQISGGDFELTLLNSTSTVKYCDYGLKYSNSTDIRQKNSEEEIQSPNASFSNISIQQHSPPHWSGNTSKFPDILDYTQKLSVRAHSNTGDNRAQPVYDSDSSQYDNPKPSNLTMRLRAPSWCAPLAFSPISFQDHILQQIKDNDTLYEELENTIKTERLNEGATNNITSEITPFETIIFHKNQDLYKSKFTSFNEHKSANEDIFSRSPVKNVVLLKPTQSFSVHSQLRQNYRRASDDALIRLSYPQASHHSTKFQQEICYNEHTNFRKITNTSNKFVNKKSYAKRSEGSLIEENVNEQSLLATPKNDNQSVLAINPNNSFPEPSMILSSASAPTPTQILSSASEHSDYQTSRKTFHC